MMQMQLIDTVTPHQLRAAMGQFATGVTVITSGPPDDVHAMTANAVTSLSLTPPLLLVCVHKQATMAGVISRNERFTVSILDASQCALSNYFAGMARDGHTPRFSFTAWDGASRLEECLVAVDCRLNARHDGGDHWILIGRVRSIYTNPNPSTPLLFYKGGYQQLLQPAAV